MALRIKCYSGFSQSNVRTAVKDALYTYINNLKLGQAVEQSDLVFEVRKVTGVDNVELPLIRLGVEGPGTGAADVEIRKDQYARVKSGKIEVWSS